jgi:chromosome partitioning protein
MNVIMPAFEPVMSFADTIMDLGDEISTKFDMVRIEKFPPNAQKAVK